ncbi:MAG: RNA polymerase sigma factor [Phycisphaerales bacterium]|nr:RNA polymerase sigma factor [Phycisphaerales bacterium]
MEPFGLILESRTAGGEARRGPWGSRAAGLSPTAPDLIARAATDDRAFAELYRLHYVGISGYILRRVGDSHLAEDLAAETFLDAWRAIGRYRQTGIPFGHWLLRIATNRVNRWARRRREPVVGVTDTAAAAPPERGDASHALAALARMAPKHQAVLSLHYVEGLSVEQVARVLECSPGTVKSRLHRARESMRRELERMEADS